MQVTALGHAGLKIETAQATILIDPWLSPEGAFLGSWFQFPANQHLLTPELLEPTAIIITHEHLDHVDPWFLAQVPAHIPVWIPQYPSPVLPAKIAAAAARPIHDIAGWTKVDVAPQVQILFVPEESPMNHDAAVVLVTEGQVLLNLNDARLSTGQLQRICAQVGPIDVLTLQGAGASWFPLCYHYGPEQMQTLSARKRMAKLEYMKHAIATTHPTTVIPFAGPPCFLDPDLIHFNQEMETGIFPDQQQVIDWLTAQNITNTHLLLPGDRWDITATTKHQDPQWSDLNLSHPSRYIANYQQQRATTLAQLKARYPNPKTSLWEPFRRYFEQLLGLSPYFNQHINMRVGFEIEGPGGGQWAVDFRPTSPGVFSDLGDCAYRYRFASRWLSPILHGTLAWEDFFLSLRFQAWRSPDRYNDHLLGLLKFAQPQALAAVEQYELSLATEETITVTFQGRQYEVQRYCPHAGQDLKYVGKVMPNGLFTCLGHHYEFDLKTGQCLTGNCPPLQIQPIQNSSNREID